MAISPWTQAVSFLGALLILFGYAGTHFKWLHIHRPTYSVVNAVGSIILAIIALHPFQLGFVVMESAWACISIHGLLKALREKPAA